jgi:hypothetical protein
MNKNSLFRKTAYIVLIVVLLLPLFAMGRPGNGLIGQLRTKHKMGQANLGKLDPTSESMRLATLGMKGIAATILWLRADYYKEEKYFDRFSATLNQISLLQPHFINVWEFQAHNLGYNVAPEYEDYRQRYEWIKKGIDYLIRGTKFNERKPMLQYVLGQQYFGSKMGKADEKIQYRSLFKNDTEFHGYLKDQGLVGIDTGAHGYDQKPDNWLTGKLWLNQATDLYEAGAPIKKSPHLLYSYSPAWRMYYADAIESEGILDASASLAWKQSGEEWSQFGTKSLYQLGQGKDLTLLSQARVRSEINSLQATLDTLTASAMPKAVENLRKTISPEELKIYDTPQDLRDPSDQATYYSVASRTTPTAQQLASQLGKGEQVEVLNLSNKINQATEFLRLIDSYRSQVNYEYWELRAKIEQRDEMIKARYLMYEADKLIDVADIKGALELYDQAWVLWDWVFRRYPSMIKDDVGDDVEKSLGRYKKLVDKDLDKDFVLFEFLEVRRFKSDPLTDEEGEKIIREWEQKAGSLSDEPPQLQSDAFSVPQVPSPEQTTSPPVAPPAGSQTATVPPATVSPATVPPATVPPATVPPATVPAADEIPARAPTLENPDFQN